MDEKQKKQSFDEEFAPEISPGYRQDVHKPPKYKKLLFNGTLPFSQLYYSCSSFSSIFKEGWSIIMKKQDSNRSKRTVKTEKGYAGDSVHTLKQVEQGNLYIAQKELGQQNENL